MKKHKGVAVITGASRGIGKTIATGLADMGYTTIIIGRNLSLLKMLAETIRSKGDSEPHIYAFDITSSHEVKNCIESILDKYAQIDVLVNNAGIYYSGSADIDEEDFSRMLDTNLKAQYLFLKHIVPVMKAQGSGYIFNVASRAGKVGFSGSGAYSASKFGMVGLSEALYRELNPLGISVTALCPGWVNTNMAVEAGTPLQAEQMIQPEDLLLTIQWLLGLSPGACVKEVILETPYNIS